MTPWDSLDREEQNEWLKVVAGLGGEDCRPRNNRVVLNRNGPGDDWVVRETVWRGK